MSFKKIVTSTIIFSFLLTDVTARENGSLISLSSELPINSVPKDAHVKSTEDLSKLRDEILKMIDEQDKHPRTTYISSSTKSVSLAIYYRNLKKRIEDIGTYQFPKEDGISLYGELIVSIPILHNGEIYEKEGGPHIGKSSGNPALDAAALRIVRLSSPFDPIPNPPISTTIEDRWVIIYTFKFTNLEN